VETGSREEKRQTKLQRNRFTFFCLHQRRAAAFILQLDVSSPRGVPRQLENRKERTDPCKRSGLSSALPLRSPALAPLTSASSQEYRGNWEQQQMACTPDVWRLCAQ
jgi:hypothetical protein